MNRRERREAAELFRRLFDALDQGHMTADGPAAAAAARRLEGALLALDALDASDGTKSNAETSASARLAPRLRAGEPRSGGCPILPLIV
jgi:hypothetical protein